MGELLDQVINKSNLELAWEEVAENHGVPGVDRISVDRWSWNWEERLEELRQMVASGSYQPSRLRIRRVPKKKRGEWRVLRIPTVTDRVLERAVLQILHPILERIFVDCSFGYRPGRGLRDAVQRIITLRDAGYSWLLDADIDEFFDAVNHDILLDLIREVVDDVEFLHLISLWLQVGAIRQGEAFGIPMGSPLSPILANLYLHPIDETLTAYRRKLVRYADDFVVLCHTKHEAEEVYFEVEALLAILKLKYKDSKTSITSFEQGFEFLGVKFQGETFSFNYRNAQIVADDSEVPWLFSGYFPKYD